MEGEEKATQTGDLYDLLSAWDLTQRKAETPPASTARGGFEIKLLDMKSTRDVTSRTYLLIPDDAPPLPLLLLLRLLLHVIVTNTV